MAIKPSATMLGSLVVLCALFHPSGAPPVPVPPKAPTVEIAPGVHMPLTIFGTAEYHGAPGLSPIWQAMNYSYVGFDTAHGYGLLEGYPMFDTAYDQKVLGLALEAVPRDRFFIITKVPGGLNEADTITAVQQDIYALGTAQVDLIMIHHPHKSKDASYEETLQRQWAVLESFKKRNVTRAIGVSNFCAKALAAIEKTWTMAPAVNQLFYHAGMGENPDGIFTTAAKYNMTVQAYSSTDAGSARILHGEPYTSIGKKYNKTSVQVALRWLVQHDPPVSYIAASANPLHAAQNIDVYDFKLSPEEMALINTQRHCKNGGPLPNCLPYWPGSEGCNDCCCKTFPVSGCCCPPPEQIV